jgi:predicted TIM-barrel enzyme
LPRPGETIVVRGAADDLGGKGANQAVVLARCGQDVRLVAAIGADAVGERIRANLVAERVRTDGLGPIAELVATSNFFNADAIIATGHAADLDYIRTIKSGPTLPTLVGSGVTSDNVGDILAVVDGVIVASALKVDGRWWNAVDPERAKHFLDRARRRSS